MNASKTAVLCDSGCDVPRQLREQYDIRVVDLIVNYSGRSFRDTELEELDPLYVYRHFHEEVPTTSALNTQEVLDVIAQAVADGYENVIGIGISSAMSGTFNCIRLALEEAADEYDGMKVFAFDTRNISIGSGFFAIWAADRLAAGGSFEEVSGSLEKKRDDIHLAFYMDTLEYLRKGGRITPAVAIVGKILNIKPIISVNRSGVYYTVGKIRGSARAVRTLVDHILSFHPDPEKTWFALENGDGLEFAEQAKAMILERLPEAKFLIEKQIVPTMAIHTGPGLLGIATLCLDSAGTPRSASPASAFEEIHEKISGTVSSLEKTFEEQKNRLEEKIHHGR